MALGGLTDELQALSLSGSDPECLLFCPTGDMEWLREKFHDIPRYLFRVFTPNSCGTTDRSWTKSMDARHGNASHKMDIFARDDNKQVAGMLYSHLKWLEGPSDNLVSWTSSLLFALVYVFYLRANPRDGSTFGDIFLCVVDTTSFPKGVFLRDMDLICAYHSFDRDLWNFKRLRSKKHNVHSGSYYFGEYLSQGALKIEDKCQIVSAQAIINEGLYDLQPKFEEFAKWERRPRPPWAEPVIRLREVFYETVKRQEIGKEEREPAIKIAQLFGPHWRLPVAANLIALLPRRSEGSDILQAFRASPFTDDDRRECSPSKTKVVAYDTLPEVQQFGDIMRSVYKDFCLKKMKHCAEEAEIQLRHAIIWNLNVKDSTSTNQDLTSMGFSYDPVLRQLNTVMYLSRSLCQEILGAEMTEPVTPIATNPS
ncbi:MAG: hypothetical protein M1840_004634 [Geoglossum simile]|nr:MAG: hypothetical protein M1840_004634 [Geoglossum simile]